MTNSILNCLVLGFAAAATASRDAQQPPRKPPLFGNIRSQGCFAVEFDHLMQSSYDFVSLGKENAGYRFLTSGACAEFCQAKKKSVMLLQKDKCLCSDVYPAESALTKDTKCNWPCSGYPVEACGGEGAASVYNVGLDIVVDHMVDDRETPQDKSSKHRGTQGEPQGSKEEVDVLMKHKAAFEYAGYLAQKSWELSKEAGVAAQGFFCMLLNCGKDAAEKDLERGYESDNTIDELKGKKRD